MSSAVISTSAAQGRFFLFDAENEPDVCPDSMGNSLPSPVERGFPSHGTLQSAINNQKSKLLSTVTSASRLSVRIAPEMVSSGVAAMDSLTGGLPRGCLTEIFGPASAGRTTLLLAALAAATRRGEVCAVVDASDVLDPLCVSAAGVDLDRLLWVRCGEDSPQSRSDSRRARPNTEKKNSNNSFGEDGLHHAEHHQVEHPHGEHRHAEHRIEQLLRVTDLLLESGGFGLIVLDLCDLPPQIARRIPLTTWFRFRRAVEHTPAVLLAFERQATAGSCSSLSIKLKSLKLPQENCGAKFSSSPTHAQLLTRLEISIEVVRSHTERRPARSEEISFASRAAWAG